MFKRPELNKSPKVSDEVRKTTCYMCACRCGIDVFLRDGKVRYIQGNRDHPVNKGVLCAKGSAGIMQQYSPARLRSPLKRIGPRGSGEFEKISWEEAIETAVSWLKPIRETDPKRLAFFTGRDQSQSFTGWWAQQFGTPNYAAHGGFCSVNMAAAGIYTMGGSFWEFGQPDWELTRVLMLFGVAEDHDSNPIKMGLARLKQRGAKIFAVNPVRTGYNAIADEWIGITPGTDGLFILALVHELLRSGKVDVEYLLRFTNSAHLVIRDEGGPNNGLIARGSDGEPLVWDRIANEAKSCRDCVMRAELKGEFKLGGGLSAVPAFDLAAKKYLDSRYAPESVEAETGIAAATIKRIAAELAHAAFEKEIKLNKSWTDFRGERHETMTGRPVSFHAMRGISAHSNGFQTCRALHILQLLLGAVERPGGFRFKPPYPKPVAAHPRPCGAHAPDSPLSGPHLGFPRGPEDLLIDDSGNPLRIDKAFSWEAPLSAHGMMHMVISNAAAADPYKIDTLFLYMANMAWNSSMNSLGVLEMLERKDSTGEYAIPRIICADAYSSETVAYADLVLPDTTYLERHDCISLLDRPISDPDEAADAIRWPVVEADRDVRGFQSVLLDIGARLKLPELCDRDGRAIYADYADYMVNHQRRPGVGPLAGWRNEDGAAHGRGRPNSKQLERYIENGGYWTRQIAESANYFKPWNAAYQEWAVSMGFFDAPTPFVFDFYLETMGKFRLAAEGHGARQPPDHLREGIIACFDPLPVWYPPFESELGEASEFPLHAITQRPAAMYHSWGSQNAWLRQIHGDNVLFVPDVVMRAANLEDDGWAEVSSRHGRIRVKVRRTGASNPRTLWTWNAIGKRRGAWALSLEAPEATNGFIVNHLISELLPPKSDGMRWANSDPVTGQAAWYDLRVRIEPASSGPAEPRIPAQASPVGFGKSLVEFGKEWSE
ncbi:MAG: molybdopterin oxidoreductase family protein [Albidovulum sp.]|nr:molybdopterin oxidoreductase family protein [Albidovulum sp.]